MTIGHTTRASSGGEHQDAKAKEWVEQVKIENENKVRFWLSGATTAIGLLYLVAVLVGKVDRLQPTDAAIFLVILLFNSRIIQKLDRLVISDKGVELELQKVQEKQEEQQQVINVQSDQLRRQQEIINDLVIFSMSQPIFRHLRELYHRCGSREEYIFRSNYEFKKDLYYLRDNGFIESSDPNAYLDIEALQDKQNLIDAIKLTPIGNFYVETREAAEAEQPR